MKTGRKIKRWVIENNVILLILSYFVVLQIINLFLPDTPVYDEKLFFGEIKRFGASYLPTLEKIRTMNSPMGPLYFIIYGFIGKVSGFSLHIMRGIHLVFSLLLLIIVNNMIRNCRNQVLLLIVFILNPYFLILISPLLYTDLIGLIFVFSGIIFYLKDKNYLLMGFLWGGAILTRQLLIIVPLAAILTDAWFYIRGDRKLFIKLFFDVVPFLLFLPLFLLWDFGVNSKVFNEGMFEENTLDAFVFSFKALNYSIMLVSIYALPVMYKRFWQCLKKVDVFMILLAIILSVLAFPVNINENMEYGSLPDTAGLLDIFLNKISYLSFLIVPLLLYWGVSFLKELVFNLRDKRSIFLFMILITFIMLESVYSYCWDKHFIVVLPIVFLLACNVKEKEKLIK